MAARKGPASAFKFAIPAVLAFWPAAGMADRPDPAHLPPVESITLRAEAESLPACEIRCGVRVYAAHCEYSEVPVCQCNNAPRARCSRPAKRTPRQRR